MTYKALYRTYRPQTFDEVVGQKHILQTMRNAVKDNKIAHAYLFTGPRGTGKTTMAKLLAKAVNCLATLDQRPCNECANCKAIAQGSYPDVIEIDAASNNGVDEVRDLIDKVKYAPINGKYKVYIVDEVHMMSDSAFNALLKTLEEPPAHIIFVLATTEVHKVLPTIVSRCQRFDFGRVSPHDIKRRIMMILEQEKIAYEPGVVDLIADLSDGGVRDAIGILDQAIAYAGSSLNEQHVRDIYGVASVEEVVDFIQLMVDHQIKDVLIKIDQLDARGIDVVRFTNQMIDIFKEALIYSNTHEMSLLVRLNEERAQRILMNLSREHLFDFIDGCIDALANFRKVNAPRALFELAMLKLSQVPHDTQKVVKVASVVSEKPKEKPVVAPIPTPRKVETVAVTEVPTPVVNQVAKEATSGEGMTLTDLEVVGWLVHMKVEEKKSLQERWKLIAQYRGKPTFAKAASLLVDGEIAAASENAFIVSFPTIHQVSLVNQFSNQGVIQTLLKEIVGKEMAYYAISKTQMEQAIELYKTLRTSNTLPVATPIVMKTSSTPIVEPPKRESQRLGEELFGSLLEVDK